MKKRWCSILTTLLLLLPLSLQILPLSLLSQLVCFRRRMHIN